MSTSSLYKPLEAVMLSLHENAGLQQLLYSVAFPLPHSLYTFVLFKYQMST